MSDERYERLRALRESGWRGPVDQDGRAVMTRTNKWGRPLELFEGGTGTRTPDDPRMKDPRAPRPHRGRSR